MVIQKLLFPKVDVCSEWEMYYRGIDGKSCSGENVTIKKGETLSLETYFNAFSVGKWVKYTRLENLQLQLQMTGAAEITAYHAVGTKAAGIKKADLENQEEILSFIRAKREPAEAEVTKSEDGYTVTFHKLYTDGIVYVEITALEDITLSGGGYITEAQEVNPVCLTLGICTFKREEFVKRNVNLVTQEIINNPQSPLYDHLEIYISDNGQTLPADTFASDKVHLFPNKNAGGAGGFTRTIIESLFHRENSPFTHIILMDDDIILDCRVLERTYHMLQMMKPEHKDAMIGGEMFELDRRKMQFEAGAACHGTEVEFFNKGWDMTQADCISANEEENPMNYSGWWYSVIPASIITKDNLPVPLFIHYDDIEYGMRNQKNGTILINGICVWHPQGPNKAPVAMNYYDIRNDLIATCTGDDRASVKEMKQHITNMCLGSMVRYRYKVIDCVFKGLYDFYKGPEYFMNLEPVENHKNMAVYNYKPEFKKDINPADIKCQKQKDMPTHVFLQTALCWLLPSKDETRIAAYNDIGVAFRARRIFLLQDEATGQGFTTERSYKEAWRLTREYFKVRRLISKKHEAMMEEWAKAKPEYTNLEFWEKYLEL